MLSGSFEKNIERSIMQIKLRKLHNHYGKEKIYSERGYAKITLLLFFTVHRRFMDLYFSDRAPKNGKNSAFYVVER